MSGLGPIIGSLLLKLLPRAVVDAIMPWLAGFAGIALAILVGKALVDQRRKRQKPGG